MNVFTGSPLGLISGALFVTLMLGACISDVRSRRIPNRLVIALAVSGLVASVLSFGVATGLIRALSGLGVGLLVWIPFYAVRLIGAGDVKLFAAASAWLGVSGALEAALVAALLGGLLALIWMLRERGVVGSARALGLAIAAPASLMRGADERGPGSLRLPYGLALAGGAVVVAWWPGIILGS